MSTNTTDSVNSRVLEPAAQPKGGHKAKKAEPTKKAAPVKKSARHPERHDLEETSDLLRILFHSENLVTDKVVEDNLTLRLKSAFTISKIQESGAKGLGVFLGKMYAK